MAQPQKKDFSSAAAPETGSARQAPEAIGPAALWSGLAEMQRQYLSSFMPVASEATGAANRDNVSEIRPNLAAPAAAISQNWMSAAAECQREITRFMNDRLAKNQAFLAGAMAAPAMHEFVQMQANWMTQAAQDYTQEFATLSNIVKNGADEALAVTA